MKTFKLAVVAVLALAGVMQVQAQTEKTNLVQTLNVSLFGFSQGGRSTFGNTVTTNLNVVQVNTRQIIQALAAATANAFSSTSKLVLVTPLNGGGPAVQVRDGNNAPVDVSDFVTVQVLSGSVSAGVLNTKNGHSTSIGYGITRVALQDNDGVSLNLHFDVNGIATSESSNPGPIGPTIDVNASGAGDRNGNLLILQGSVDIFGHTLEVFEGGGVS